MKKFTTQEFVTDSNKIHNGYYSYSKTEYKNAHTKVIITCPIHGDFEQRPHDHKKGLGCKQCKSVKQSTRQQDTLDTFIKKATSIHGDKYEYSCAVYTNSKTKIDITCKIHGNFKQTPTDHLQGRGCKKCSNRNISNIWSYSGWEEAGANSKQFAGYSLYIVECWNDSERFVKIGKTYTDIKKRLSPSHLPYEYCILDQIYGSANYISLLENYLHNFYKKQIYEPKIDFGGKYECYIYGADLFTDIKTQIKEFKC